VTRFEGAADGTAGVEPGPPLWTTGMRARSSANRELDRERKKNPGQQRCRSAGIKACSRRIAIESPIAAVMPPDAASLPA